MRPEIRALLEEDGGIPDADTETGEPDAAVEGNPLDAMPVEDDGMPNVSRLRDVLRLVMDPEIGYSIVDLGLVYDVSKPSRGRVHVLMTLTTMGCPLVDVIQAQCDVALSALPGVDSVEVEFTFSPPWSTDMIEPWVQDELRAMGMHV